MNAEVADILSKNKSLADFYDSFIIIDNDKLARVLTNEVIKELNYRKLKITDLPMEYTLPLRFYITLYVCGEIDRKRFITSMRNMLSR